MSVRDYPRPQLVRDEFRSLDGPWLLGEDPYDVGIREGWFSQDTPFTRGVTVPFPPEAPASGIGEDLVDVLWYRRQFEWTPEPGRLLLHFEAVDYEASVWVNGRHIGDHEGGQSRFSFDITDVVEPGANVLVLRSVDRRGDLEQPRGKQDWQDRPHVIWYRRTSGIWRSVWMETVPDTHIGELTITPRADLKSVDFECRIEGPIDDMTQLAIDVHIGGRLLGAVTARCFGSLVRGTIRLEHEEIDAEPENLWWTPDTPRLLDVSAALSCADGTTDSVTSYTGLRTVGTDGAHVLLNGRPLVLRLVLEQGYWPDTLLSTPSPQALRREAELIKTMGFNGIRMHQTSADPRFLRVCDEMGLLVMADTAAAYRFSTRALRRSAAEMAEMIRRDAGHPCVIAWVPFNESWGVPNLVESAQQREAVAALYHLAKALDPTRLAMGNDGWQHVDGDLIGIHDYAQNPAVLRAHFGSGERVRQTVEGGRMGGRSIVLDGAHPSREVPVLVSEFGGISAHDDSGAWRAYGDNVSAEELPGLIGQMVTELTRSEALAGFCYTQLSDTDQEKNGLVTADRIPKCDLARIREAILA